IADDHHLMLAAVRMALAGAADIEIVGEAHGGAQLLALARETSPNLVLLDLRMPGIDGLRCLELLRERHPSAGCIVLSGTDEPEAVAAAFERGAVAFIRKTVDPADLGALIRQAHAGNVICASAPQPAGAAGRPSWDLTEREAEVLRALAGGRSNKQMAQDFWLSSQTIKYHLRNVYRKLGVSTRTEAVRKAYEHGLIESPQLRVTAAAG
ncbi:MAG: hypothetical protein V7644_1765, partial [Actinomycetota bacterium]